MIGYAIQQHNDAECVAGFVAQGFVPVAAPAR
jgi:hypothetical protein